MPELKHLSVAMATYNGARYLQQQLVSLAAQTCLPDELVVCDDGSSDGTQELVRDFAGRAPFAVVLVENSNRLGYRRNFIEAGRRCRGEIVFFCDQDDVWLPNKIEAMVPAFDNPSVMLAYHNAVVVDDEERELFSLYDDAKQLSGIDTNDPLPFHFSLGFTQAYRPTLHRFDDLWPLSRDHVSDDPACMAHDQWYFFLAGILGRVAYVPRTLVRYRQHGGNTFGIKPELGELSGVLGRLRLKVLFPVWSAGRLAETAQGRSRIAEAIAERSDATGSVAPRVSSLRYRDLARRLRQRYASCYGDTVRDRLPPLLVNVRENAYAGTDRWHFQLNWLIGDVLRAVWGSELQDGAHEARSDALSRDGLLR